MVLLALIAGSVRADVPTTQPATQPAAQHAVLHLAEPPDLSQPQAARIIYWETAWQGSRPVRLHLLRIDLADPNWEVVTLIDDDPDGDGPAEAILRPPAEHAARHGAVAAVNANAFWHVGSISDEERKRGWYAGKHVNIAGAVVHDGVLRSPPEEQRVDFWIDADGRGRVGRVGEGARQAVSNLAGPLLHEGKIVANDSPDLHPRSLVGVDASGRYMLLVVADGRQRGYSEGLSLRESAELMRSLGCRDAINLDGGGSSIMLTVSADGYIIRNRPSDGRPRPVPVMLGVIPRRTDRPEAP